MGSALEARRAVRLGRRGRWARRQSAFPPGASAGRAADRVSRVPTDVDMAPFSLVYQLDDEFAAELANRTVHTVMHLGWVPDDAGGYRGQMAVLVKPNGRLGSLYMAGIAPLRRFVVYPALLHRIERQWRATAVGPGGT
ncbi:MAG: DUF2867 domain-containing protein [Nocardioidaceae bacterium]